MYNKFLTYIISICLAYLISALLRINLNPLYSRNRIPIVETIRIEAYRKLISWLKMNKNPVMKTNAPPHMEVMVRISKMKTKKI